MQEKRLKGCQVIPVDNKAWWKMHYHRRKKNRRNERKDTNSNDWQPGQRFHLTLSEALAALSALVTVRGTRNKAKKGTNEPECGFRAGEVTECSLA